MESTKVTIGLRKDLLKMVDDYAKKMHVNRSSAVSVLLSQSLTVNLYIEPEERIKMVDEIIKEGVTRGK